VLSAADVLDIFEEGRRLHPVDRGLLLLARGYPEIPYGDLAALTVGRRDASLLRLRARHFGDRLHARAQCPKCERWLTLEASCCTLLEGSDRGPAPAELQVGTIALTIRPPDSRDLAAIAASETVDDARTLLLDRCVAGDAKPADLSERDREVLAEAIAAADPHAEKLLALSCPDCGHHWELLFDIVSYLWNEIAAEAGRVLREVDVLARTYGWCEAEILRLSEVRRHLYVEMARP
jgi:hypothetical protein